MSLKVTKSPSAPRQSLVVNLGCMRPIFTFLCVMAACVTAIIVTGYGPVVWGWGVGVVWWIIQTCLWVAGACVLIASAIFLVMLWASKK